MKAYLIDPFARTVSEVEHDGTLASVYRLLGCSTIDAARPSGTDDVIYVDDEGLFREEQATFFCKSYPHGLAGKGLWVGTTPAGDDATPRATVAHVRALILWER
jgi:hypothetical protein